MLRARDWPVRVVVELDVFWSPPQQLREAVGEDELDHGPERRRPALDATERRPGPVELTNAFGHLAASGEEVHLRLATCGLDFCHVLRLRACSPADDSTRCPATGAELDGS